MLVPNRHSELAIRALEIALVAGGVMTVAGIGLVLLTESSLVSLVVEFPGLVLLTNPASIFVLSRAKQLVGIPVSVVGFGLLLLDVGLVLIPVAAAFSMGPLLLWSGVVLLPVGWVVTGYTAGKVAIAILHHDFGFRSPNR